MALLPIKISQQTCLPAYLMYERPLSMIMK